MSISGWLRFFALSVTGGVLGSTPTILYQFRRRQS